ncbi:MAG TPA: hypothetical protein VJ742_13115 [Nitrososphaera sp.]|nr:hypothetical protein [Nitrososphaera sp.]
MTASGGIELKLGAMTLTARTVVRSRAALIPQRDGRDALFGTVQHEFNGIMG